MTVSFRSNSFQYKKLSWVQRGGRAQHCVGMAILLFFTTHIIPGGLGFRGKKRWIQPWKCTLLPPSVQQIGCKDLPCGLHPLPPMPIPYLFLWDTTTRCAEKRHRWGKHRVEPRGGGEPEPSWVQPELKGANLSWGEPSGARQSGQKPRHQCRKQLCGIESSIQSSSMVRCGQSCFWGFVCHCFLLPWTQGQGESAAGSGHHLVLVPAATWN